MKKKFVWLVLSAALVSPLAMAKHSHTHAHWSYTGDASPEHWGDLAPEFAVCKTGKQQSPVDLAEIKKSLRSKGLHFNHNNADYEVENNGHTLKATPLGDKQTITLDNKAYVYRQFHFHTPGEHTFKGHQFPMEAHFVYRSEAGDLAVISVMYREGKANPALTPLIATPLKEGETVQLGQKLNIRPLFPKSHKAYRLDGSLTTPPCKEGVKWVIYETPVEASAAQIKAMAEIIGQQNNRPVQPLNGREIVEVKE